LKVYVIWLPLLFIRGDLLVAVYLLHIRCHPGNRADHHNIKCFLTTS